MWRRIPYVPDLDVMDERIFFRIQEIRIFLRVPLRVEKRMRTGSLFGTVFEVVDQTGTTGSG